MHLAFGIEAHGIGSAGGREGCREDVGVDVKPRSKHGESLPSYGGRHIQAGLCFKKIQTQRKKFLISLK